jgi:hypothetical protein
MVPLCVAVAQAAVVARSWDAACDKPLKGFLAVDIVLLALFAVLAAVSIPLVPEFAADLLDTRKKVRLQAVAQAGLGLVALVMFWLPVGCVWVFGTATCGQTARHLYRMSLATVILELILLLAVVLVGLVSVIKALRVALVEIDG